MKKGSIVNIYSKPYSLDEFEGKAKLIKKLSDYTSKDIVGNTIEQWEVKFISDNYVTSRFVSERI